MENPKGKFEYLTAVPCSSAKTDLNLNCLNPKDLQETYNRLFNSNQTKHETLKKLKRQVEDHKKHIEYQQNISENTSIIQKLQCQIHKKEQICLQESLEQAILINKRENLKLTSSTLKGKLIELQKNFDRITTNYEPFKNSYYLSKNSLLLINKVLEEHTICFEGSKNTFKNNIRKLEKKQKKVSETNAKIIKRSLSVDDAIIDNLKEKVSFFEQYENCLKDYKEIIRNKENCNRCLEIYKEKFGVIRDFVDMENGEKGYVEDYEEESIRKIIQKLKFLEYRSESLNFTHQKLSEQEAFLNQELSAFKSQLQTLQINCNFGVKDSFFPYKSRYSKEKSFNFEIFIIKTYFQLTETLYESFSKLATNIYVLQDKNIEFKVFKYLDLLKDIKSGIHKHKHFIIERVATEKFINRQSLFDSKYLSSLLLNPQKISEMFLEYYPNEEGNIETLISYVETSPIIKIVLDKDIFREILQDNIGNDFLLLSLNLVEECNSIFKERIRELVVESEKVIIELKKSCENLESSSSNYQENINDDCVLSLPFDYKIKKYKSQSISPYKVMEKPKKKLPESFIADPIPIENKGTNGSFGETQIKSSKHASRVYSLSTIAFKRQKVMKEVLENQRKETLLRTIEKKISKQSEKYINLPYMKKFILRSSLSLTKLPGLPQTARKP
ncbi:hypothetical protein SteCoe_9132 [Stentor coeruleus]|uniref:Uncharacterized protein n=1 Tax=Stentor coeruleus TaxID=5963 RepID=A0A1R2CIK9_9CILI|nr:hypothetical protein SteCoe_9132 [Stentor coeruleus]